ncbi:MAG TPA: hypothetical protein VNK92_02525 [Vicinamibacterales bacterium]|nr:hypothetical protein [Vicinamibacterales bacterium]
MAASILLSRALPLALALALPACAHAGWRDRPYGYGYGHSGHAFENGYREGYRHGERDARRGLDFAFAHAREYQRADKGYRGHPGGRAAYRLEFRRGYEVGYRDGYYRHAGYRSRRRGRFGISPRLPRGRPFDPPGLARYGPSPAAYGYREGFEKGMEDARDGDPYDPRRHRWYREGDRHYDRRYGPREAWKDKYRRAFLAGYDEGYRRGRW